jgi:hypothetical protein
MGQSADLPRGRAAARRYAWAEAFEALSAADGSAPLAGRPVRSTSARV